VTKEKRNENQSDQHIRDDQGKALRFYTEVLALPRRLISARAVSLADGGLARGAERH